MKKVKESKLKSLKGVAALVAAISAGLTYFEVVTPEQLTGMVTALGTVFAAVYGIESKQKKDDE